MDVEERSGEKSKSYSEKLLERLPRLKGLNHMLLKKGGNTARLPRGKNSANVSKSKGDTPFVETGNHHAKWQG